MMDQKKLIHSTDWDVLVVLDSCRYDYLAMIEPSAKKAITPGTTTETWIRGVFPDFYPWVYISGMPTVEAKGLVSEYVGLEHFEEVVEVWDFGWDDELKVTPPDAVMKAYLERKDCGKRMIVHFGQPHLPYIGDPPLRYRADLEGHNRLFNDLVAGRVSVKLLREAYFGNVKLAWKYAREVIKSSGGKKIVVTADHGERLMEPDSTPPHIGHGDERCPQLVGVPWVVVEG